MNITPEFQIESRWLVEDDVFPTLQGTHMLVCRREAIDSYTDEYSGLCQFIMAEVF